MPFFKRLTPEEKQEREAQKKEREYQALASAMATQLADDIFPNLNDEVLKEIISNLPFELSYVVLKRTAKLILKLEGVISHESEVLLGYYGGFLVGAGLGAVHSLLIFTSVRIIIITEGKLTDDVISYDELESVDTEGKMMINFNTTKRKYSFGGVIDLCRDRIVEAIEDARSNYLVDVGMVSWENCGEFAGSERSISQQLGEIKQLLYSRSITQSQYDVLEARILGKSD